MRNKILACFKKNGSILKEENLIESLSIKHQEIRSFNRAINDLLKEKRLFLIKNNSLADASKFHKGTIVFRHNGSVIAVDSIDSKKYEIDNAYQMNCLNKDDVFFDPDSKKVLTVIAHHIYKLSFTIVKNKKRIHLIPNIDLPYDFKIINKYNLIFSNHHIALGYISSYEKREITIIDVIGDEKKMPAMIQAILYLNNIAIDFPKNVLKEAELLSLQSPLNLFNYQDCSNLFTVTIDGDDSKDFDDAFSLVREKGGYCLYIHIADVAAYVKEESAIDREAYKRGTSIYYPGSVIPMLPKELSDDICSLMPDKMRATITVEIHYDWHGHLLKYQIYPALIKSKYRLTYKQVNNYFKEKDKQVWGTMLDDAYCLAKKLRSLAKQRGAIEFSDHESVITVKNNKVISVASKENGESEKIIESFMIEANTVVAYSLYEKIFPAIYRNHDQPDLVKLNSFINLVNALGYTFDNNNYPLTAKDFKKCLTYFKDKESFPMVQDALLRSMSKAKYSNENHGHYALGLNYYCHFTSPIRRYPDLFVHRMLHHYFFKDQLISSKQTAKAKYFADLANIAETQATEAERNIEQLMKCAYMQDKIGEYYDGIISGLTSFGIFIRLENTVEGMAPLHNLNTFFELQKDGSLSDGQISYHIGDKVKIKVNYVDMKKRLIDFIIVKRSKNRKSFRV